MLHCFPGTVAWQEEIVKGTIVKTVELVFLKEKMYYKTEKGRGK